MSTPTTEKGNGGYEPPVMHKMWDSRLWLLLNIQITLLPANLIQLFFLLGLLERTCPTKKQDYFTFWPNRLRNDCFEFYLEFSREAVSVRTYTKIDSERFSPDHWDFRQPSLIIALEHEERAIRQICGCWGREWEWQLLETLDFYFRHLSIFFFFFWRQAAQITRCSNVEDMAGLRGDWKSPGKMTGPVRTATKIG